MSQTSEFDVFLECNTKGEISIDNKLNKLTKRLFKMRKGCHYIKFIPRRLSNPEKYLKTSCDDEVNDCNQLIKHKLNKNLSETCLVDLINGRLDNVLKNQTLLKKSTEIVEEKIKMYINRFPFIKPNKRTKMKRLAYFNTPKIDAHSERSNDNIGGYDIENKEKYVDNNLNIEKLIPLMNNIDNYYNTDNSSWSYLRNNYPNSCTKLEKSLDNFLIRTNCCVTHHNTTDPTERFFIQQLIIVTNNVLFDIRNNKFPQISMETLTNYVNDIQQIYYNQSKMKLKYASLNSLMVRLLKVFEYGIRMMECVEIPPIIYSRIVESSNLLKMYNTTYTLKSLLCRCFNKVVVTTRLISVIKNKQRKSIDRIHSTIKSMNSTSRHSPTITRKLSVSNSHEKFVPIMQTTIIPNSNDEIPVIHGIDDFTIVKLISQGACATVYLVKDARTYEHYALKMIGKRSTIIKNRVKNVFAERDILSVTNSPFIVELYCSFETATHICLLTEYVHGGDCASLLRKRKPFPTWLIRHTTAQLILAIEHIHRIGIVHRDIKPANVLLAQNCSIKLTDFGLSTVTLPLPQSETTYNDGKNDTSMEEENLVGTPDYFAPEIIKKLPYGKLVDWWCLGLFMYETTFTEPPFYGDTIDTLFDEILYGNVPWPTDIFTISDTTKNLIEHFLEKDPNDRWGDHNINTIKSHDFFENFIDWNNINQNNCYIMKKSSDISDTRYFDDRSEFYDHETDLMSDLSLDDFSKFSENDVFNNYQYSSPSFSNKIRLSTSVNQFSDDSHDSTSIKNTFDSSVDSNKNRFNTDFKQQFNPTHRSSLVGTLDEHRKSDTFNYKAPPNPNTTVTSLADMKYTSFPQRNVNSKQPCLIKDPSPHDLNCTQVTLLKNDWIGVWPGFIVDTTDLQSFDDTDQLYCYYIKEIINHNVSSFNIHTDMFITHINGIVTNSMTLNDINLKLQYPESNILVLTLTPKVITKLGLSVPFDKEVGTGNPCRVLSCSNLFENNTIMDVDINSHQSFSNSTFNNEEDVFTGCYQPERRNSNLEQNLNDSLYLIDNTTHRSEFPHDVSPVCDVGSLNVDSNINQFLESSLIESSFGADTQINVTFNSGDDNLNDQLIKFPSCIEYQIDTNKSHDNNSNNKSP